MSKYEQYFSQEAFEEERVEIEEPDSDPVECTCEINSETCLVHSSEEW
jgi:hypothetical protein